MEIGFRRDRERRKKQRFLPLEKKKEGNRIGREKERDFRWEEI